MTADLSHVLVVMLVMPTLPRIHECLLLYDFSFFDSLPTQLKRFAPLQSCTQLRSLNLSQCAALTSLEPLTPLSLLEELDCSHCQSPVNISALAACRQLTAVDLSGCTTLRDLCGLACSAASLVSLDLTGCWRVEDVAR